MNAPLLEARNVRFGYSRSVEVVRGISLSIRQGSFCALIGPNGSGKSTLLRLLAGILSPREGEIRFEGRSLAEIERRRLATRVGYVPQGHSTVFPFTALEVVLTGRSPYTPRFRFENEADREVAAEPHTNLQTNKSTHAREDNMRLFGKLSIVAAVAALIFSAVTPAKAAPDLIKCGSAISEDTS